MPKLGRIGRGSHHGEVGVGEEGLCRCFGGHLDEERHFDGAVEYLSKGQRGSGSNTNPFDVRFHYFLHTEKTGKGALPDKDWRR